MGFMLHPNQGGTERLIACGGKSLSPAQRVWPIHEREAFAIVAGLKHFDHYLSGAKVIIRTDQASLKYLFDSKQATGKIARWKALISSYDYRIEHIKGTRNPADFLSRREYNESPDSDLSDSFRGAACVTKIPDHQNQKRIDEWREKARQIPILTDTQKELVIAQKYDTHFIIIISLRM